MVTNNPQQDEYLRLDFASRFAEQIPGSKLVLLEGVRHFLFATRT